MSILRLATMIFSMSFALTAMAQWDDIQDWRGNGRPERYLEEGETVWGQKSPMKMGSQATAPLKAKGVQYVPVVLVAFNDMAFTAADTDEGVNAFYQKFCNGTMDGKIYTGHGSHGSIRDYFVEQSDSVFFPEFVVIGPVTLDNGYAYYGGNSGSSKDTNFSKFRNESIKKAMEVYTDWEMFDNDGNGTIDMVFFVYAGLGENTTLGKYPNLIWPKETSSSTTINGRVFATSAATCECRPAAWNSARTEVIATKTDGVGVFIHELSHALGLPDFYDTKNVAFGMDLWSVMDYGQYGNNGYNPGNYTAYERDFMGWRKLIELKEPCILTIPCFADGGTGYKIVNEANADEYYIIENRQARGWDDKVCTMGHGLQVTHVDYNKSSWTNNNLNTVASHQRMTIIAANNNYNGTNVISSMDEWFVTLSGNLYPGSTGNHALTDDSTPAATVFAGGLMGKPLRNITENADGTVMVCYCTHGKLDAPVPNALTITDADACELAWPSVENATKYVVEIYDGSTLLEQDTLTVLTKAVEDLEMGSTLTWRVKAMANSPEDYLESEWSEMAQLHRLSPVTITADDQTIYYGDELPAFTYSVEGTDYEGMPEISSGVVSTTPVGIYDIEISAGTIATQNVTYVGGKLTVLPAPLTVSVEDYEREQGEENPEFEAFYEGWKNDEDESVLTAPVLFSCLATLESPVGTYEIQPFGAEAANYDISYVSGWLSVVPPVSVSLLPESDQMVDVYTTSGILVSHCKGNEVGRLYLRRGIYIVRYANGSARRVLIR